MIIARFAVKIFALALTAFVLGWYVVGPLMHFYGWPPTPRPAAITAPRAVYVSAPGRPTYHRPTCRHARTIDPAKRSEFATRADAEKSGRRACGVCSP